MTVEFVGNAPQTRYIHVGVEDDHLVNSLTFVLDRMQNSVDLSACTPHLSVTARGLYADQTDGLVMTTTNSGTKVELTYALTDRITSLGCVDMELSFEKETDGSTAILWQTQVFQVSFDKNLQLGETLEDTYPDLIQRLLSNEAKVASDAAEAKRLASSASSLATTVQYTADDALEYGKHAVEQLSEVKTQSAGALQTANEAKTAVAGIQTTATEAKNIAAGAKSESAAAATKAEEAAAAAGNATKKTDQLETTLVKVQADLSGALYLAKDASDTATAASRRSSISETTAKNASDAASLAEQMAELASSDAKTAAADAGKANLAASAAGEKAQTALESAQAASASAETAKQTATRAASDIAVAKQSAATAEANSVKATEDAALALQTATTAAENALTAKTDAATALQSATEAEAAVANKANIDGYYAGLTAGLAESLVSTTTVDDETAFVRRTTAGEKSVSDGFARIAGIYGRSVVWNQLIDRTKYPQTQTKDGITFTNNGDGSVSVSGSSPAGVGTGISIFGGNIPVGHKYFLTGGDAMNENGKGAVCLMNQYDGTGVLTRTLVTDTTGSGVIFTLQEEDATSSFVDVVLWVRLGSTVNLCFRPQLFDLTKMFGTGNEPEDPAEFRKLFPELFYEKENGKLLSVGVTGIKTIGFNLFDSDTVLAKQGWVQQSDGSWYRNSLGSLNYLSVFENTYGYTGQFCGTLSTRREQANLGDGCYICARYTDGTTAILYQNVGTEFQKREFRTASGKTVSKLYWLAAYDNPTYVKDICIHFCWSGYRNGEYEKYRSTELSFDAADRFPSGMHGIGTVRDEIDYENSEVIQRIGIRAYADGDATTSEMLTDGKQTCYVLASPVVTKLTEAVPQYWESDFGTEEWILSEGHTLPVTALIRYMNNLRDKLQRLPEDAVSGERITQTTGSSPTDLMSQAAITAALAQAVFTPSVSADGVLSWTNSLGLENPASVNLVQAVINAMSNTNGSAQ